MIRRVEQGGTCAAAPERMRSELDGKPTKETGALLTISYQNVAAGWRMTGWAWTRGKMQPASWRIDRR